MHPRCQAAHACAPKRARMAALEAAARARLLTYRVILILQVDQALDSPASWDWPTRLGLRPPEGVVAHVERLREETGQTGAAREAPIVTRLSGDDCATAPSGTASTTRSRSGSSMGSRNAAATRWRCAAGGPAARRSAWPADASRRFPVRSAALPRRMAAWDRAERIAPGPQPGPSQLYPPACVAHTARVFSAPRENDMLSPFANGFATTSARIPRARRRHARGRTPARRPRTLTTAGWAVVTWTMARGWVDADGRILNQGQGDPLRAVQALATLPEKTVAVFFDLHPYLAQLPEMVRAVRDAFPAAKATQRPLLFCSPEPALPVEWEKDVAPLDYPLPSREALRGVLDELVAPAKVTLPPAVRDAMLEAARGLTWNEAENAFALALMRDRARIAAMPATVQAEKTALVRKSGLLDLLTPAETLDGVGGLAPLKAWIAGQGALLARAAEALAWGFAARDLPKGVLLLGVPGTGKSLCARDRRQLGPPAPPARDGPDPRESRRPVRGADAERPPSRGGDGPVCPPRRRDREDAGGRRRGASGFRRQQPGGWESAHLAPGARTRPGRDPRAGVRRGDGKPGRGAPAGAVPPRPVRPGVLPRPPRADGARRRPRDSPPGPAAGRAA